MSRLKDSPIFSPARRVEWGVAKAVEETLSNSEGKSSADIIAALIELDISQERAFEIVQGLNRENNN